MSWAEDVKKAVARFGIPCAQGEWKENRQTYLVFNGNLIPDAYADDSPQYERILVDLHLFAPIKQNTMDLRREIKLAIHEAGFSYPSETTIDQGGIQREAGVQHVVFEFEGVEAIPWDSE